MDLLISLWPFFLRYGYAILFFGIALENAGLPLPGEVFLLTVLLVALGYILMKFLRRRRYGAASGF